MCIIKNIEKKKKNAGEAPESRVSSKERPTGDRSIFYYRSILQKYLLKDSIWDIRWRGPEQLGNTKWNVWDCKEALWEMLFEKEMKDSVLLEKSISTNF